MNLQVDDLINKKSLFCEKIQEGLLPFRRDFSGIPPKTCNCYTFSTYLHLLSNLAKICQYGMAVPSRPYFLGFLM
jgi:hypothetical protein